MESWQSFRSSFNGQLFTRICQPSIIPAYATCSFILLQETDDDLETSLEGSQDDYEGNKDAARALMRVKQKLDGYEEGEMRSVHGQVILLVQCAQFQQHS